MKKIISFLILILVFFANISFADAETSYLYYYWDWCPHCAKVDEYMKWVDEYMKWVDGYNRIDIEKKEVYFNKDNAKAMSDDGKRLWYENVWVPFLIVNEDWKESVLNWDKPIIDYFIPILGEPKPNNNKYIIIAILWLIVILVPIFIIKWWNKN